MQKKREGGGEKGRRGWNGEREGEWEEHVGCGSLDLWPSLRKCGLLGLQGIPLLLSLAPSATMLPPERIHALMMGGFHTSTF